MSRATVVALAVVGCAMVTACGEKPQTNAQGVKYDAVPWSGTGEKAAVEHTAFSSQADATVGATQADGNSIDVDNESAKLAANALEHQAAVQVAHVRVQILRSAIGVA